MKNFLLWTVWLVFVLIFASVFILPENLLVNGTTIVGWFLLAIQSTYNNSERFYLAVKRLWFNVKNPSCIWNMQAELHGDFERGMFDKLNKELKDIGDDSYKIITISNTRRIYKIQTLNLEVALDEGESRLHIYIHDLQVSFRDSKEIIDKKLSRIFETIQYVAKANKGSYGMNITFKEYNPYFGFFVRRLNDKDVQGFNIKLKVSDDRVIVSNSGIEINTDELNKLNQLSKSYLALSHPR